jgi:hypothetical protein
MFYYSLQIATAQSVLRLDRSISLVVVSILSVNKRQKRSGLSMMVAFRNVYNRSTTHFGKQNVLLL